MELLAKKVQVLHKYVYISSSSQLKIIVRTSISRHIAGSVIFTNLVVSMMQLQNQIDRSCEPDDKAA